MNNTLKILYVTQTTADRKIMCGVSLLGNMLGNALEQHPLYQFEVLHTDTASDVINKIAEFNPKAVIYNYHQNTTPWMDGLNTRALFPNVKHVRIVHDSNQGVADAWSPHSSTAFEYLLMFDPSVKGNDHVFITNRIIPDGPTVPYVDTGIPIIGHQGFPAPHKGLPRLVTQVQSEWDEAIVRLHIPPAYMGGIWAEGVFQQTVASIQQVIYKPNVRVEVTNHFLDDQGIVDWLGQNTINCYFYDYQDGAGLSSSVDYALACGRPMAVTRSHQMRHLWDIESIQIEKSSLKQIIADGTSMLEPLYKAYSKESVWQDYTNMLQKILG